MASSFDNGSYSYWGQLGDSYLVPRWITPVVTLFQDRGPNHKQIQWTPFHLDILCWHKSDYHLEIYPDPHKGWFCYFLQIFLIAWTLMTSTKMGEKYHVMNDRKMIFVELHSNDLAECSTFGSTNSQYFSVKFHDLMDN